MKNFKLLLIILSCLVLSLAFPVSSYSASSHQETSAEYLKDSSITADVKARLLADDEIKSLHISVKTVKGVVFLTGYALSKEQREKAVMIASKVDGVKSVKDKIIIKKK